MKRTCSLCLFLVLLFACYKQPSDTVYDSHLFPLLQAHSWVLDSARVTDSAHVATTIPASDTAQQITEFASQLYIIRDIRDTTVLDSTYYQSVFVSPRTVYFFANGGVLLMKQYLSIDTVNDQLLILSKMDSTSGVASVNYYHAE